MEGGMEFWKKLESARPAAHDRSAPKESPAEGSKDIFAIIQNALGLLSQHLWSK